MESFRHLFHLLDSHAIWPNYLTPQQLQEACAAAQTSQSWTSFLHKPTHVPALIRRRLAITTADVLFEPPPPPYEYDHGLLPPDKDDHELQSLQNLYSVIPLLPTHSHKSNRITIGLLGRNSTDQQLIFSHPPGVPYSESLLELHSPLPSPTPTLPEPPSFPPIQPEKGYNNILQLLTPQSPVVRNVIALEKVRRLRTSVVNAIREAEAKKDTQSTVVKEENVLSAEKPVKKLKRRLTEIYPDQPVFGGPRSQVMATSSVALLLAHGGYTDAGNACIKRLSESLGLFIEAIGTRLAACRVNIDNNQATVDITKDEYNVQAGRRKTNDEQMEELSIVCASVRGGCAGLMFYARGDMVRAEQAIRGSDQRLKARVAVMKEKSALKMVVEEEDKEEEDVSEGEGGERELFGYMGGGWVDVLGGVRVPLAMVKKDGEADQLAKVAKLAMVEQDASLDAV